MNSIHKNQPDTVELDSQHEQILMMSARYPVTQVEHSDHHCAKGLSWIAGRFQR